MKTLFEKVAKEIAHMPDEEFLKLYEQSLCGELRWLIEYGWNPDLDEFDQWKLCFRHMWE